MCSCDALVLQLQCIIQDEANRYCACEGYNDGSFMISCNACEEWFHGRCVWLDEKTFESSPSKDDYECPGCCHDKKREYIYRPNGLGKSKVWLYYLLNMPYYWCL